MVALNCGIELAAEFREQLEACNSFVLNVSSTSPDDATLGVHRGGNLPIGRCLTAMDMVACRPPRREGDGRRKPAQAAGRKCRPKQIHKRPCLARQERGYEDLIWIKSQSP